MDDSKIFMFPDAAKGSAIDPGLLALINNNGGFGGNGSWIWLLFMWMIWGANGNNGWGNNNNGTGYLSNQLSNTAGRDLLLQAINGRADAAAQLASITNTSIETVKSALYNIQTAVQVSGLQTINAQQLGDANLSHQLCDCCCSAKLESANQTAALQSAIAAHDSNVRLQLAQNEASDQLAVCKQTNELANQASVNTNNILGAIKDQNAMIVDQFCQLKERELQSKIDIQGDLITQLRNQISNDKQTAEFTAAFNTLNTKVNDIANRQPATVPVIYPNLTAISNTPYNGGFYGWNNGSYWG